MGETSNKEKCFEYFSKHDTVEKDELISKVMKEFGITKNTAQMYYYNWKKEYLNGDIKVVNRNPNAGCKHERKKEEKEAPDIKSDEKLTEEDINELCENTQLDKGPTAVCEKSKPKRLLKIALLQGKTMSYEIQDGGFLLRQKSAVNAIPIDFKDIDDFIAELMELKEVIV